MRLIKEFKRWLKARYNLNMDKSKDIRDKIDSKLREADSEIDEEMDWI